MPVRHFDELGDIYSINVRPKTEKQTDHLMHEQQVGNIPADTFPQAGKDGNAGKAFDDAGPESAENFEPSPNDTKKKKKKKSAYDEEKLSNPVEEGLFGRTTKGGAKGAVAGAAGGAAAGALTGVAAQKALGLGIGALGKGLAPALGDVAGKIGSASGIPLVGKTAAGIAKSVKGWAPGLQTLGKGISDASPAQAAKLGAIGGGALGATAGGVAGATHGALSPEREVQYAHDEDPDDEHSRRENGKRKLLKGGGKRVTQEAEEGESKVPWGAIGGLAGAGLGAYAGNKLGNSDYVPALAATGGALAGAGVGALAGLPFAGVGAIPGAIIGGIGGGGIAYLTADAFGGPAGTVIGALGGLVIGKTMADMLASGEMSEEEAIEAGRREIEQMSPEELQNAPRIPQEAMEAIIYQQQNLVEGEKNNKNKINNSTMKETTNKSTFDRLFEDVMSEDFDDFAGGEGEGDLELGGGEEFGDEEEAGGDFVTLELPREIAEVLHMALMDQLGGGEDEMEDLGDAEEFEGEEELEDSYQESHVELERVPDTVSKLATTNGGNNQVEGQGHKPAGGSAATDASGEVDGGKPKKAPEGFNYAKTKNNRVGGKVKGGNKDLFKA